MTRKSVLPIATLCILSTRWLYHNITNPSLEHQAALLSQSLSRLSGDIKEIRQTADNKEKRYQEILTQVTNYQPAQETKQIQEKVTESKPLSLYKCIVDDSGTIEEKQYNDNQMEFVEDCGAFEKYEWCYIAPNNDNCFKVQ